MVVILVLVNGVSFLAVIAGLLAMRNLPLPATAKARESLWARLQEGFRFAVNSEGVRSLLLLRAIALLESRQTLAQQLAGEMEHARMRVEGKRLDADAGAAAERLQPRSVLV